MGLKRQLVSMVGSALLCGASAQAQDGTLEEPTEVATSEMDLFALESELKAETRVASRRAQSIRETPGVVTVMTREEIVGSGARDLLDVLRLVPGFSFGMDVSGVVGAGFRGNWGHEGKVLLLIDGQEMNENLYSTLQFGNHYPVDDVERVEVIRGPGSAVYGGYAELAVINVVTRGAAELSGGRATLTWGQLARDYGRRSLSFAWGQKVEAVEGLEVRLSGHVGQGQRSDMPYRDIAGGGYPMAGNSELAPLFLNLGAKWDALQLRVLVDRYGLQVRDGYDVALERPWPVTFDSLIADGSYQLRLAEGLTLTPRLSFHQGRPWRTADEQSPLFYDKSAQRLTGRLQLAWDVSDTLALTVGAESFLDRAWLDNLTEAGFNSPFPGGATEVGYTNVAGYAELLWETWLANVVAGARVENHSAFGASFVPRLAVTKLVDRFHFKALWARAFRAPGIENMALGVELTPERTTVLEAEAGYQLTDSLYVSANAYDIGIGNPIVYFYDEESGEEGYRNFTRTGTRGVEAELRFKTKGAWANLGYSFYRPQDNEVDSYRVEGREDVLLGMPAHKLTLNAGFNPWGELYVHPSAVLLSERYGFAAGEDGEVGLQALPAAAQLNLFVRYRNLGLKGLELGVGVYDILDAAPPFPQPYDGGHAPLPNAGRELLGRLSYTLALE